MGGREREKEKKKEGGRGRQQICSCKEEGWSSEKVGPHIPKIQTAESTWDSHLDAQSRQKSCGLYSKQVLGKASLLRILQEQQQEAILNRPLWVSGKGPLEAESFPAQLALKTPNCAQLYMEGVPQAAVRFISFPEVDK